MKEKDFSKISARSGEEGFSSFPPGYEPRKTRYIVVMGTVISGLGKGIAAASLGYLLKKRGYKVSAMKFDGYLNVDAGTLNPFRHGEVFVLDDGTECDMDLGTYERFLDQNFSKDNYLTGGKLFNRIIQKERAGEYLGRDVQFIPHVTGEIKRFIRELALKKQLDVLIIEVGGTVGDIENSYFIEAMRQFASEEGKQNVLFLTLTYIIQPSSLGEQKSKAAQLGIKLLMGLGIQPDVIVCRSENPLSRKIREKISIYSNVPVENVFSSPNLRTIYELPIFFKNEGLDKKVVEILGLGRNESDEVAELEEFVKRIKEPEEEVTVAIAGKYTLLNDSYASILKALEHAGAANNVHVNVKWVETTEVGDPGKELAGAHALIVPGGYGKRGVEGKIECVRHARENNVPFLGLCYGFQMAVIEYARNVLGLEEAHTTEVDPSTPHPVICLLPGQEKVERLGASNRLGGRDVQVIPGTRAWELYGRKTIVRERFRHRFEANPEYVPMLEEKGLVFSGKAPGENVMQILELPDHPFFMATQFHPEYTSRPLRPHPLFKALVKAALEKKRRGE